MQQYFQEYRYILYLLLAVVFILWFKVAVDNWNKDAIEYNEQMKEYCPCDNWHYVTKGYWECDCPQNDR
jgi:hypothetical protein